MADELRGNPEHGSTAVRILPASNVETAQRQWTEQALFDQQQLLRTVTDNAQTAIFMADAAGRGTFVNPAAEQMTGYRREELIGQVVHDLIHHSHPDGKPYVSSDCPISRALELLEELQGHEDMFVRKDGTFFPVRCYARPIVTQGSLAGTVIEVWDITKEKQVEDKLRATQQQLQIVTDSMPIPVTRCSRDLRFVWVNQPYSDWMRLPVEQIIGRPIRDILGQEAFDQLWPYFTRVLAGERVEDEQAVDFSKLGRRWVHAVHTPTLDASGLVDGWVAVVMDIDDRKRAEQALQQADRRKDEFLATLAHELRNPLAPIRNAVQLMRMQESPAADLQIVQDIIDRQVLQMTRLVDDLLEVGRITQGRLQLRKERIDMAAAVRTALEATHPLIEASAHELTVTLPPEPIYLDADPTRLAQIISNLLNNAVKYTERGGHIWLHVEREDGHAVVSVRDTGIGIAAEHLPGIFEMFSQVAPALERSQGGLGIGLALVRGLVELHGGQIEASSAGPGKGSEFVIRLPQLDAPLATLNTRRAVRPLQRPAAQPAASSSWMTTETPRRV